ncbi:MAG: glycosyltransferase family 4 protein [Acidithiobacillus sp.]|uniref:glycosyltransferase family 4 protein n=1 Tax=Acidithiobacillus sp. TaxID=1872118 RepID=UPI003D01B4FF
MKMASLHLALLTETFPPEVNGVARTLQRLVDVLTARGHRVSVLRPRQRREAAGPHLFPATALPLYPQLRVGWALPGQMSRRLHSLQPDLLHVATEGPLGLAALLGARRLDLPVVSSFHTNFDGYAHHYGLRILQDLARAYLRRFHNATLLTLVPSKGTQAVLAKGGFRNLALWRRGVDGSGFHPRFRDERLRAALGLQPDDVLLLNVGRLALEKNIPAVLGAFRALSQRWQGPQRLHLALVGDGPLLAQLRREKTENMTLAGMQVGTDLARWYASADLFCFPSCSETFGNVVLEAMASGLPVLAYDCPGVNEQFRHGEEGVLLPRDGDFAAAMEALCREPDLRRAMGNRARQRAEGCSWEAVFDELLAHYQGVLERHGRHRRGG